MNCTFLFCLEFCCLCFCAALVLEEGLVDAVVVGVGQDIVKYDDCACVCCEDIVEVEEVDVDFQIPLGGYMYNIVVPS